MPDTADTSPWAQGPAEILEHAQTLIRVDTESSRRIAMILVDNSVEQALKTYLSLPVRVTGLKIPRKKLAEISGSFPALLDTFEEHGADKLDGVDLGAIEWFHRVRNQLYHDGFGLTVERLRVERYADMATVLLANLFGYVPPGDTAASAALVGRMIEVWNRLERALSYSASFHVIAPPRRAVDALSILESADLLPASTAEKINRFRMLRNRVVHAQDESHSELSSALLDEIEMLAEEYESLPPP